MRITAQMLRDNKACEPQVNIFEREWPSGVEITEASILRMVELSLEIEWGAETFLTALAWKAHDEATAQALIRAIELQEKQNLSLTS